MNTKQVEGTGPLQAWHKKGESLLSSSTDPVRSTNTI